jgi:hypothetical protein
VNKTDISKNKEMRRIVCVDYYCVLKPCRKNYPLIVIIGTNEGYFHQSLV